MSATAEKWVAAFEAPRGPEAEWLGSRRAAALHRFRERGFPTRREEAWKYTNPQRISEGVYQPAPATQLDTADLAELALFPSNGTRIVFVNGHLDLRHSSALAELPSGLRVVPIGTGFDAPDATARAQLEAAPTLDDRSFASIAEAFFADALLVSAEANAQIEKPVDIVFVSTGADAPFGCFPRVCVHAETHSRLAVREIYLARDAGEHLTNAFSQYHAGAGATLERCSLQMESTAATYLGSVVFRAERDARITNRALSFGALTAREDLVCELGGTGAECDLQGLYLTGEGQHSAHHTTVDHRVPQCTSQQLYRGVLAGRSRAAFTGTVIVRSGAQQSNAQQKNESLLLSARAEADSKPQLEIYADDVKCSHGSTIGQLDPDQVFYLRSRGISEEDARATLIRGFASAISDGIGDAWLRGAVNDLIAERLRSGVAA